MEETIIEQEWGHDECIAQFKGCCCQCSHQKEILNHDFTHSGYACFCAHDVYEEYRADMYKSMSGKGFTSSEHGYCEFFNQKNQLLCYTQL